MTVGGSSDIDAGTYPGTLIAINEKRIASKFSTSPDGMDDAWEWVFSLEDGTEVNGLTSTFLTPKSRAFGYLVALVGKEKVTSGAGFELSDLIGKTALVSVEINDAGWPRIVSVMPPIGGRKAAAAPAATQAAFDAVIAPAAAAPVAQVEDDLPF
jgi:hypothetical protein